MPTVESTAVRCGKPSSPLLGSGEIATKEKRKHPTSNRHAIPNFASRPTSIACVGLSVFIMHVLQTPSVNQESTTLLCSIVETKNRISFPTFQETEISDDVSVVHLAAVVSSSIGSIGCYRCAERREWVFQSQKDLDHWGCVAARTFDGLVFHERCAGI